MADEFDAIDTVARAVDRIVKRGRFAEFELTNGIVLRIKSVPPLLLGAVNQEYKLPDPPMADIGKDRLEENPSDPAYIRECQEIIEANNLAINDLLLAMGTEVASVPDGYYRPEEEGWVEKVKFASKVIGREITMDLEDEIKRYLFWLRFYAFESAQDAALAQQLPMQLGGISEGEVDEVIDSFRSIPERRADSESSTEAGSANGNTTNRAARRSSARNRGA